MLGPLIFIIAAFVKNLKGIKYIKYIKDIKDLKDLKCLTAKRILILGLI
jgi:hypothetical protein